jgi:hypothetical protein
VHPILGNDAYLENCLRVKVVGQPGWGMFPLRQNLYKPISNFEQAQVAQKNVMKKSYAEQELAASRPSDDDFRHSETASVHSQSDSESRARPAPVGAGTQQPLKRASFPTPSHSQPKVIVSFVR